MSLLLLALLAILSGCAIIKGECVIDMDAGQAACGESGAAIIIFHGTKEANVPYNPNEIIDPKATLIRREQEAGTQPLPAATAASGPGGVGFTKAYSQAERMKQQAALAEVLRRTGRL